MMNPTIKIPIRDMAVALPKREYDREQLKPAVEILVGLSESGVEIGASGYGEKIAIKDHGYPIYLEFHEGHLRLHVWADINNEEPTHIIDLEGARESARKDSKDTEDG